MGSNTDLLCKSASSPDSEPVGDPNKPQPGDEEIPTEPWEGEEDDEESGSPESDAGFERRQASTTTVCGVKVGDVVFQSEVEQNQGGLEFVSIDLLGF